RTVLPISLLHFPTRRSPPPRATRFPYTTLFRSPGGTILYEAHKALEQICVERDTLHYKQQIALKYADLVYNGQWFHPLREALQAFVDHTNATVTGMARVRLFKGRAMAIAAQSPH